MTTAQIISIVVFVVVMALVVSEKIHRTVAALSGAVVLILLGIVTFDGGMESIDFGTLGVLVGMMMFVGIIKACGIFEYMAIKSAKLVKGNPWLIMMVFAIITAVCSAFLDNVTTVLLIGPVTYTVCRLLLDINPIPFFMVEILASNIGGTATLIGDPPNIMIGSAAGFSFFDFLAYDTPVIIVIMVVVIGIFYVMYGRNLHVTEDKKAAVMELDEDGAIHDKKLFHKSVAMILIVAVAFCLHGFANIEPSTIALTGAAVMFLISGADIEKVVHDVEWTTIGFFAGLFIVVGGMEQTGVIEMAANALVELTGDNTLLAIVVLVWAAAILSSFLDNIPLVAAMAPILISMGSAGVDVQPLWWALSLGACLGGCGTLIGASANVVMASISNRNGYPISFIEYTKVGFPVMIVCVAIACAYLVLRFCVFA